MTGALLNIAHQFQYVQQIKHLYPRNKETVQSFQEVSYFCTCDKYIGSTCPSGGILFLIQTPPRTRTIHVHQKKYSSCVGCGIYITCKAVQLCMHTYIYSSTFKVQVLYPIHRLHVLLIRNCLSCASSTATACPQGCQGQEIYVMGVSRIEMIQKCHQIGQGAERRKHVFLYHLWEFMENNSRNPRNLVGKTDIVIAK